MNENMNMGMGMVGNLGMAHGASGGAPGMGHVVATSCNGGLGGGSNVSTIPARCSGGLGGGKSVSTTKSRGAVVQTASSGGVNGVSSGRGSVDGAIANTLHERVTITKDDDDGDVELSDSTPEPLGVEGMSAVVPSDPVNPAAFIMKLCRGNKWAELNAFIEARPDTILTVLAHDKSNPEDAKESTDYQTTSILHKVLRSRSTNLCGRVTVINTILQSPHAQQACRVKSNPQGTLPLHVALHRDNKMDTTTREQVVAALVKVYPEATIAQAAGKTPLHIMSRQYSSTVVARILIEVCPSASKIRDDKGWLPIHHACRWRSSPEKLKLLIDAYPESVLAKTEQDGLLPMDLVVSNATKSRPHLALISMLKESMKQAEKRANDSSKSNNEIPSEVVTHEINAPGQATSPEDPIDADEDAVPFIHVREITSHDKALLALCKADNWSAVEQHIRRHPQSATSMLRDRNSNGTTVLHKVFASASTDFAARIGVIETVLQICPKLASVKNGCGSLPLHLAARNSYKIQIDTTTQEDVIASLINVYPAAAVTQNAAGRTPLHIACAHFCSSGVLRQLLNAGRDAANKQDKQGCLPIHLACRRSCSVDKLELLLDASPESVFAKTRNGETPLDIALMDFSSNPRQSDRFVYMLQERLEMVKKSKQVEELADNSVSTPELFDDKSSDDASLTSEAPSEHSASTVTASSSNSGTGASDMEAVSALRLLSSSASSAKPRLPTKSIIHTCNLNECVLTICRANAWRDVAEFILSAEPDCNELGTILHYVLKSKDNNLAERMELIQFILDLNPNAARVISSVTGTLPLHVAMGKVNGMDESMRRTIVEGLIKAYPEGVGVQDREKMRTPLHLVLINRFSTAIVKMMLEANSAAASSQDKNGWLPIHHACKRACPLDQLKMLVEANPKGVSLPNNAGDTPMTILKKNDKDLTSHASLLEGAEGENREAAERMVHNNLDMFAAKLRDNGVSSGGDFVGGRRAFSEGGVSSAPPLKKRRCEMI